MSLPPLPCRTTPCQPNPESVLRNSAHNSAACSACSALRRNPGKAAHSARIRIFSAIRRVQRNGAHSPQFGAIRRTQRNSAQFGALSVIRRNSAHSQRNSAQFSAIRRNAAQCGAIRRNAAQCGAMRRIQRNSPQFSAKRRSSAQWTRPRNPVPEPAPTGILEVEE